MRQWITLQFYTAANTHASHHCKISYHTLSVWSTWHSRLLPGHSQAITAGILQVCLKQTLRVNTLTAMSNYKQQEVHSRPLLTSSRLLLSLSPLAPTSKVGTRLLANNAAHDELMAKSFQRPSAPSTLIPSLTTSGAACQPPWRGTSTCLHHNHTLLTRVCFTFDRAWINWRQALTQFKWNDHPDIEFKES